MCEMIARVGGRETEVANAALSRGSLGLVFLAAFLFGCASPEFIDPASSPLHPANPAAVESPTPKILRVGASPASAVSRHSGGGHGAHHHGGPTEQGHESPEGHGMAK